MPDESKFKKLKQIWGDAEEAILEQFPLLIPLWRLIKREAHGVKEGWILFVTLALVSFGGGYFLGRHRQDSEIQTLETSNRSLRQELSELRAERDKYELKITILEKSANLPVQSNSPPDKRFEILLERVETLVKALPPDPQFELLINNTAVPEGAVILLDKSRTFKIGVRNLSEITAENVTVRFGGQLNVTNVTAGDWVAKGESGTIENQEFKPSGFPIWTSKSQDSLPGGQFWTAWPITISTNWSQPFFTSTIFVHSDRSKAYTRHLVFVFTP